MTKEEIIFCEKSYIGETNCTDCNYYGTDTCQSRVSHKMVIKALEQEPCEDCVSRKELIDKLEILDKKYGSDFYWEMRKIVDKMPMATPTRKAGKWICVHHIENKITYDSWKCSECQHDFNSEEESMVYFDEYKYCPNCGAEMESK